VNLVADENRAVYFDVAPGQLTLTSSSVEVGSADEVVRIAYAGEPLRLCMNGAYVLDFLNVVESEVVALELKDEVSQAVMKPVGAEGYDYTYVIMPMRV
jgi:DNA polymerase-3 subunit beta